jgi:outer membrane protein assembly factor BamB
MIDLGYVTGPDTVSPSPARHRRSRSWFAAGVVAVVLLCDAGSVPPPADPLRLVASIPVTDSALMTVVGSIAYVLDGAGTAATLGAYALPGGRLRWLTRLGGEVDSASLFASADAIVTDTGSIDGGYHDATDFDPATGRVRWRMAVTQTMAIPPALFVWPSAANQLIGGPGLLDRVDPVSGRVVWSAPIGEGCETQFDRVRDPLATGLVEWCEDHSDLAVLDLTTGTVRARRHLDGGIGLVSGGMTVQNGVVLVAQQYLHDVGMDVTAFRATDLGPMWSTQTPSPSTFQGGCSDVVCVATPQGRVRMDLRTGAVVTSPDPAARPVTLSVSAGILEIVIAPPAWATARVPMDVTLTLPVPDGEATGVGGYDPGYATATWFTRESADGTFRPLGALYGVGSSCSVLTRYVVCATAKNRISLWRLPPVS